MEPTPPSAPQPDPATVTSVPIRHLELKAALLLVLTGALVVGYIVYVLYARGVFDHTQRLVLVTDNSEGVFVGMDLTFAGFAIGRVRRIELGEDGKAQITIAVPVPDARWLRVSSVFTMERALVGGTRIRAFSGQLGDPPLPDGAVRAVLRGDATDELPALIATMKGVLENLQSLTAADSSLGTTLGNVRTVTERMAGRSGVLAAALGSEENAKKVIAALDRSNKLLDSMSGVSAKLNQTLDKTDQRMFGAGGVMDESQKAVVQLNAILGDARESLKKADAVLADAQKIGANASAATDGLGALRGEVDASLRKVNSLIDEVNRKWPFKRDTELKLP
jgi:phospholipid/cholesterol/gamma-HCH transport system substrate-binding protein